MSIREKYLVNLRFDFLFSNAWQCVKLIHLDLDPTEIGKNYPVAVGIVSDAKAGLAALPEVELLSSIPTCRPS